MEIKTDIEIAQSCQAKNIREIAATAGVDEKYLELYGNYKAKVDYKLLSQEQGEDGKLILVTAITPTPAGEGKTTTSVGLADGLRKIGKKSVVALREPSLGPVFGVKGGAAGGGYAQVIPMEDINLHFTGDFHAIGAANNLLAAMLDNHIQQGNALGIDVKQITWKRAVDMNDRQLRHIVDGLGGKMQGVPREDGFEITVASEIMAVLCLSTSLMDMKEKLGKMIVAYTYDGKPVTAHDLKAEGAMTALLKDALKPNLVQTLEHTPALIHGGPFANIAHGCNSVAATRAAMTIADWAITEAGFGSDLGAEKFYDIKCRMNNLQPAATILVTSLRALKWHGGVPLPEIGKENMDALINGLPNLKAHIASLKCFGQQVVVSLNHFANDNAEEIDVVRKECLAAGVRFAISDGFAKGGEGALDVAREVMAAVKEGSKPLNYAYSLDESIEEKIQDVNTKVYGGQDVSYSSAALKDLAKIKALNMGFEKLPICIAKTPFSMSHDPDLKGAPHGFTLPVQRVILNAGAGFLVVTTGAIMRMPGLPKKPAAYTIDVVDGKITGLS